MAKSLALLLAAPVALALLAPRTPAIRRLRAEVADVAEEAPPPKKRPYQKNNILKSTTTSIDIIASAFNWIPL